MKITEVVGIDVSKKTLDVAIHTLHQHKKFENTRKGFISIISWVKKLTKSNIEDTLFCFEHTGIYNYGLALYFSENNVKHAVVSGLEIKRSLGIVRDKNDKIDAFKIAMYAYMRRDTIRLYKLPSKNMVKLQNLLTLREKVSRQKGAYNATLKEYRTVFLKKDHTQLFSSMESLIKALNKQLKCIDKEIIDLIKEDELIYKQHKLLTSIKGIGSIVATHIIVTTNCFTLFENSRKYACYCGIAPFASQSGTSLNKKHKVSHFANKKIKSLLYLAACSAIQHDLELKMYYMKAIEKGKSKLSVINVIKNKLVSRMFAVIKRETPYVSLYNYAA